MYIDERILGFKESKRRRNEVVESGRLQTPNSPVSIVAIVLVMNWLYFRCWRSILVPLVFHASANMSAEIFMTDPDSKNIQTGLMLILSAIILRCELRVAGHAAGE